MEHMFVINLTGVVNIQLEKISLTDKKLNIYIKC